MVMLPISEEDKERIAAAVAKAEQASDGEIVTVVAPRSDAYHDVGLHYAILAMLLVPAGTLVVPQSWIDWWLTLLFGWGAEGGWRLLMLLVLGKMIFVFLVVRYALAWMPLRMAVTPKTTKHRRVQRRAVEVFHATCAQRTKGQTAILLYLSLLERRAEIVADEAIHSRTEPEVWGAAMAALVTEIKAGRPGEGLVQAVEKIGDVLAKCLPAKTENPNELPDRLIEL
jgi:putative membrane protein